jgi:hypothetical protein
MSTLFDEVASPEAPGDGHQESENGDARRRQLILLGTVGGVAVIAALGYFVVVPALSGGSDNSNAAPVPVVHHAAVKPTTHAPVKPAATPTSVPTISAALTVGRDPFAPLVVAAAASSSSPSAGAAPTTSAAPGDAGGATPTATPTSTTPTISST